MRQLSRTLLVLACVVLLPTLARAQSSVAGIVRDASGAVLPGVTVEVSSPALIEKSRTATTDGSGQYRVTDLPPGTYMLTFSLSGFATVKRDAVTVSGSGVVAVNADLRVGNLSETITVSGESPLVDTQSTRRETVIKADTLATLPATRGYGSVLATVPALNIGGVAGAGATTASTTPEMMFFTAHGGDSGEGRVMTNGLTVASPFGGGGVSGVTYDISNSDEMQVLVSGGLGEAETGGPSINIVPKSGGNVFQGTAFYSTAGAWSASDNLDDSLRAVGITTPPVLRTNFDISGSLGGPIVKDRLWFFGTLRQWGNAAVRDGIFANAYAGDPAHWDYLRKNGVESRDTDGRRIASIRVTGQVAQKHRLSFAEDHQRRCSGSTLTSGEDGCRQAGEDWVGEGRTFGANTGSPESWPGYHNFPYDVTQVTHSAPLTSRMLVEGGFSRFAYDYARFGMAPPDGLMDLIPVTEQTSLYGRPNFTYRGIFDPLDFAFNDNRAVQDSWRAALSYATGAHSAKIGYMGSYADVRNGRVANHTQMRYTFINGVANSVSYFLAPRWDQRDKVNAGSIFAQDQWTRGRLTVQGGIRWDHASSYAPAEGNGTTETSAFNPQPISFARTVSVSGYNDITPRAGLAYDVFGNGKTALKVHLGKYVQAATADSIYSSNNPAARIVTRIGVPATPRAWTDGNRNNVVDCDLLSTAAQNNLATGGDSCGALGGTNLNFGNANPNTTVINPDILSGWGVRPYDWQFGINVQHEVVPRVSVDFGYNRRWWGNFFVTDNTLTTAADYDHYDLTVPQHDHMPNPGSTVTYVAITPAAAARGAQSYMTAETDFGDARTAYWHGFDFNATARLANGLTVQGGTSTGRGVRNYCAVTTALPELLGADRVDSCDVTERWATSFRGLAAYTVPKVDVLISASMRSLLTTPGGGVATNGAFLNAAYVVPNSVILTALGRLPANASLAQTTTVNLLKAGDLYTLERISLLDMRFAKIVRFGGKRLDVGMDLYNLFNSNVATAYQQTYEYATNGASWLNPTAIAAPRLARFNVTLNF
jgi:hypothetical protein